MIVHARQLERGWMREEEGEGATSLSCQDNGQRLPFFSLLKVYFTLSKSTRGINIK